MVVYFELAILCHIVTTVVVNILILIGYFWISILVKIGRQCIAKKSEHWSSCIIPNQQENLKVLKKHGQNNLSSNLDCDTQNKFILLSLFYRNTE